MVKRRAAALMRRVRQRLGSAAPGPPASDDPALRQRLRKALREIEQLRERVRLLEVEVQESRQLGIRVAELGDVVTELLAAAVADDDGRFKAALERYAGEL